MKDCPIVLEHNLDPQRFMWLWAKYVRGVNDQKHCTNSLLGKYSHRLGGHNTDLQSTVRLVLDEFPPGTISAVYICGVAKQGYRNHENYPHNLHATILPQPGRRDMFSFENWLLKVENGVFDRIPALGELPEVYRKLPDEFTTCRIFRWAVCRGKHMFGR